MKLPDWLANSAFANSFESFNAYVLRPVAEPVGDFLINARQRIQENNQIVAIVAGVAIVIAGGSIVLQIMPKSRSNMANRQVYYYDLNTNKLFTEKARSVPPIVTDSGDFENEPAGVRAYVFACGDCSSEKNRFVGYLMKNSPEARKAIEDQAKAFEEASKNPDPEANMFLPDIGQYEMIIEQGRLIKRVEDEQWVNYASEDGFQITVDLRDRCSGKKLKHCMP